MNIELARLISLKLQLIRQGTGIYVAENGVYLAEVGRLGSGIVLTKAAFEAFPAEMDDISSDHQNKIITETILKCYQAAGSKPANACSSPPPSKVVIRYFQLPNIPTGERNEAIRFEGSRYVPFKLNDTISNYYVKETASKENLEVVFNAMPIHALRQHVDAIEEAKVKLWDTEPAFYALVRALRDKIGKNQEPALVVNISSSGNVCICVLKNHVFYVCRDFFLSFKDPNYLEKFFFEINSCAEYFRRHTEDVSNIKIFLGGDDELEAWKARLEEYFQNGTEVEIIEFPAVNNIEPKRSSGFLIPIGLALKALGAPTLVHDVSLLDVGVVADERVATRKRTGIVILILLFSGVLFYFGYYMPQLSNLRKQITTTRSRVAQLADNFPDVGSQPVDVLEQRVASVEEKTKLIEVFQTTRSFLNEKLLILAETVPPSIWFTNLSYNQEVGRKGELSLGKRTLQFQGFVYYRDIPEEELRQINEYAEALKKNGSFMTGFGSLDLGGVERISYLERGFTKFRISLVSEKESKESSG